MQRISVVNKWTVIEDEKQSLAFTNPRPRNVRLEVNSAQEVEVWYACQETGEAFFLALVKGRDVIEFGCVGPFALTAKGGFLQVFTNDGDDISLAPTAEAAFVKVMERQRRNPELEYIAWKLEQNMNRRLEQQAYELEQLYERRAAAAAAATAQPVGAGTDSGASAEPAPPASGGEAPGGAAEDGGEASV